jgi:hypothetical protein
LIVTPSAFAACLTSANASGAVAKRRTGDSTWLRNVEGGAKLTASSGCLPRSLARLRTRVTPRPVSARSPGSRRI